MSGIERLADAMAGNQDILPMGTCDDNTCSSNFTCNGHDCWIYNVCILTHTCWWNVCGSAFTCVQISG